MATIRRNENKGSVSYTVSVRKTVKGQKVFDKSETFEKRKDADEWGKALDVKLSKPGVLEALRYKMVTVGELIQRYLDEYGEEFGKSKKSNLNLILRWDIADIVAIELTSGDIVQYIKERGANGAAPPTCLNDVIWLRNLFKAARSSFDIPVDLQVIEDANDFLHREGLIAKAGQRERRPTHEELMKLSRHFWKKQQEGRSSYPMFDIMWFAIYSCRRDSEITRLRWDDNKAKELTGLVRDAKHPTAKKGNHQRFKYTKVAWRLANRQPKKSEFIFPYDPSTISSYFTNACKLLAIKDLKLHDLRHEAVSRLFETGYDIVQVQMFSLHRNWNTLRRYTHLKPGDIELR